MTKVHIELQRVQTWLFSVPRLRAMVGANALLAEVLRVKLPSLARETGEWSLARQARDGYPPADSDDPLQEHDNPATDAADGILSRDGGHFEAVFARGAERFAEAATVLLREELPGLRFRVSVDGREQPRASVAVSHELPILAPCEWTGRGIASEFVRQADEQADVSVDVARRHEAATRTDRRDLASLLAAKTKLGKLASPRHFNDLAGNGYLAVIHADGNDVGGHALSGDAARAAFFHRNRVLLRRALQVAIDDKDVCQDTGMAPLVPLMLGGDDLLVVCRAKVALKFIISLCAELDRSQKDSEGFRLTMGTGVVFAKPTIPIHRLHDVAERLAASAKRRVRGISEPRQRKSVVDWAVYTTSWVDDPEEVRRRDWVRGSAGNIRVLSRRPVDVLGDDLCSLEGLVAKAGVLKTAPRSQLRFLVDQLPRGKELSELAFRELSPKAREAFRQLDIHQVWADTGDSGTSSTSILDLVDIFEIDQLGSKATIPSEPTEELEFVHHG